MRIFKKSNIKDNVKSVNDISVTTYGHSLRTGTLAKVHDDKDVLGGEALTEKIGDEVNPYQETDAHQKILPKNTRPQNFDTDITHVDGLVLSEENVEYNRPRPISVQDKRKKDERYRRELEAQEQEKIEEQKAAEKPRKLSDFMR